MPSILGYFLGYVLLFSLPIVYKYILTVISIHGYMNSDWFFSSAGVLNPHRDFPRL